jgi:polysaccharide export outer membrane protein
MKRILVSLLALLFAALAPVQADNLFRNGDIFEMRLSGPPEEFTKEFNLVLTVDEGSVNLPLIGRVTAVGMSSTQLASSIERRLKDAKIFTIANVNITQNSSQNQRIIIVGGSVRQPGKQIWIPDLTLTGAISAAGGPTEFAKDGMRIIRGGRATSYSRKAIRKNPTLDPKIEPNDSVEQEGE